MGPIWGLQDPVGPHVGIMKFVIWEITSYIILCVPLYQYRRSNNNQKPELNRDDPLHGRHMSVMVSQIKGNSSLCSTVNAYGLVMLMVC